MIVDTIKTKGVIDIRDVEYKGNFTINYKSKSDLEILQMFFGVRRSKFDMALLEKRPELLCQLKGFKYDKNSNR